jgi:hypothetical protein
VRGWEAQEVLRTECCTDVLSGRESVHYSDVEQDSNKYVAHDVDATRGEPARLAAATRGQACRSGVSAGAVEVLVNNAG